VTNNLTLFSHDYKKYYITAVNKDLHGLEPGSDMLDDASGLKHKLERTSFKCA
jgi:hypothetical protein